MIHVKVNGTSRDLVPGASVSQLVGEILGREPIAGCAVALNGEVVRRADWPATIMSDGDAIEIVHATQGG